MERLIGKATGNSGKFHIASRGGPLHAHLLLLWFHLEPILCLVVAAWMKGSEMMRENQSSILIYNIWYIYIIYIMYNIFDITNVPTVSYLLHHSTLIAFHGGKPNEFMTTKGSVHNWSLLHLHHQWPESCRSGILHSFASLCTDFKHHQFLVMAELESADVVKAPTCQAGM